MRILLASYFTRYLRDSAELERSLKEPVLLYEPPDSSVEGGERFQLHTSSATGIPQGAPGEPLVLAISKSKNNAFPRGVTVGRTANNDLVFDHPSVSRFHAWFQRDEQGQWTLQDAGSKNGTRVGGEPLVPKRPHALAQDSRLRFGHVEVGFLTPGGLLRLLKSRSTG